MLRSLPRPEMEPAVVIDEALLRSWPLPLPPRDGDKEARGHVLIVAGSREMPGAAWLAATAALRAGAGKLVIATARSVASALAVSLPESRVIGLSETKEGGLQADGVDRLEEVLRTVDAVLLGPGWLDERASKLFASRLIKSAGANRAVVLDAMALASAPDSDHAKPYLLTPHAGEMAHLLGISREAVVAYPEEHARSASERWQCIVALKGSTTVIAHPNGMAWRHTVQEPGLGTSGSGDMLAGLVTGLAARGIPLEQAAVWGVALHALAGKTLGRESGLLGYLARELPAQIPPLMRSLAA